MTMQNHRLRGLREENLACYNPCPAGFSQQSLLKAAGRPVINTASSLEFFAGSWKYGTGLESEEIQLPPGEPDTVLERITMLRGGEAREFLFEKGELGFVLLRDPYDLRHVLEESLKGLERAYAHWDEAGQVTLAELQAKGGWNDEQMRQQYRYHWVSYANAEAAKVLRKHVEKLEAQLAELPAAPARGKKKTAAA